MISVHDFSNISTQASLSSFFKKSGDREKEGGREKRKERERL